MSDVSCLNLNTAVPYFDDVEEYSEPLLATTRSNILLVVLWLLRILLVH
jgi:hypothetical protein